MYEKLRTQKYINRFNPQKIPSLKFPLKIKSNHYNLARLN